MTYRCCGQGCSRNTIGRVHHVGHVCRIHGLIAVANGCVVLRRDKRMFETSDPAEAVRLLREMRGHFRGEIG